MYQFVTGPLLWISFLIFFAGVIFHIVQYLKGLDWKLDRVAYTHHIPFGLKGALRSICSGCFHLAHEAGGITRFLPFGSLSFIGLVIAPIFLQAHNLILRKDGDSVCSPFQIPSQIF